MTDSPSTTPRWLVPVIVVIVGIVALAAALALSGGSGGSGSAGSSPSPVASASADASADPAAPSDASTVPPSDAAVSPDGSAAVDGAPVIQGTPLPPLTSPTNDTALGMTIPTVTAPGGSIQLDGRAKILLFLAHWCPHCQAEVPVVQDWLDAGGLPASMDLISVATGIDPGRPNYPPEDWLEREGWTPPVIMDVTDSVAEAYGLTAYPFWVFVDAQGRVAGRISAELTPEQLDSVAAELGG